MWSATSAGGMVVTAHYRATMAGVNILKQGGNAVDAAVAASLALSVCESAGSGLGGMGMMLLHLGATKRTFTIEGACRAPSNATPDKIDSSHRYRGYGAVAVPGLISVLDHALCRYGTLNAEAVTQPAIELACSGFPITPLQHDLINQYKKALLTDYVRGLFLADSKTAFAPGTLFKQPELAATLAILGKRGLQDFYLGEVAEIILRDMKANGGFINHKDLEQISVPRESMPLQTEFDNGIAMSIGPPAGALSLMQLLKAANGIPAELLSLDQPEGVVRVASMIQAVRRHRREYRLQAGNEALKGAAKWLETEKINEIINSTLMDLPGTGETSHLCVADSSGNWVSMTQSIERSFGAGVAAPELGFLYNGYLRAFKIKNRRHPHYLRPGAPARSNAAPTMLLRDGRPVLAIGSTGSERLQSGILQVLLRLRWQSPFAAVHAPRFHCTPEGEVLIEAQRFPPESIAALQTQGFTIKQLESYAFMMGGLQLLIRSGESYTAVSEPRRDGLALGV